MAPHTSTLAWKIPWTEEPGRLQSMGSLKVGHDWATSLSLFTFMHWRRKWQPTPVLLPGKPHGWRSLVGWVHGVAEGRTRLHFHFHFSLLCIGEGNGNPLQCSCLENPRDGEPGGLPSKGSHRVGHNWSDLALRSHNTSLIVENRSVIKSIKYFNLKIHTHSWTCIYKLKCNAFIYLNVWMLLSVFVFLV